MTWNSHGIWCQFRPNRHQVELWHEMTWKFHENPCDIFYRVLTLFIHNSFSSSFVCGYSWTNRKSKIIICNNTLPTYLVFSYLLLWTQWAVYVHRLRTTEDKSLTSCYCWPLLGSSFYLFCLCIIYDVWIFYDTRMWTIYCSLNEV